MQCHHLLLAVAGVLLAGCSDAPPTVSSPVDGGLRPDATSRHYVTEGDQTPPPDAPDQTATDIFVGVDAKYDQATGQAVGQAELRYTATDWELTVDLEVRDENNGVTGTDHQNMQDGSFPSTSGTVYRYAKYLLDKACDRRWHANAQGKVWSSFVNVATMETKIWGTKKDSYSDDAATRLCDDPPPDDHNPCDDPTTVAVETCSGGGGSAEKSQYTTDEPTIVAYTSSGSRECDGGILWFSSFDGGETWRIDYFECTHWVENME